MKNLNTPETYFWKVSIILLGLISLSTGLVKSPGFWTSYVLDIAGPAWIYILIRGQYKSGDASFLSFKFSPEKALVLIIGIGFLIETAQYFKIYEAHFDPWDYVAYVSGVLPIFIADKLLLKKRQSHEN